MRTDTLRWDAVVEERVAEAEKLGLAAADVRHELARAREVFGDDISAVPKLVLRNLLNYAPWTYVWFHWFAGALSTLEAASGYSSLIRRLNI